jgi:two-component system response regulator YesN
MLELAYIKSQSNSKKAESRLDTALRYIKQFHTQNITLNDLAHHLGCSRSSLSHTFKAELGKSFREYLTDLRINDAKSLLRYSALTVTEIAFSVGFSDSAYFSLVFKKSVGASPTEYRKSHTA